MGTVYMVSSMGDMSDTEEIIVEAQFSYCYGNAKPRDRYRAIATRVEKGVGMNYVTERIRGRTDKGSGVDSQAMHNEN
jgi:hypothetical protein